MLQSLFCRSLRGRHRLVFLVSFCKARGKHANGRGGLPSFSSVVRARVFEISIFALKNRRLLGRLILCGRRNLQTCPTNSKCLNIFELGVQQQNGERSVAPACTCNVTCPCVMLQRLVCAGLQYSLRHHAQHCRGGHT